MSCSTLHDDAARTTAVTDFQNDLIVVAGAGTGKTSLLIERILIAIGEEEIPLDRIVAITFTKKAAGEMRERLAEALERLVLGDADRGEGDPASRAVLRLTKIPDDSLRERWLAAEAMLDRAAIDTIHGFCSRLLREYPLEANVDPAFQIDEGEFGRTLLHRVWAEWLEMTPADGGPRWEQLDADVTPAEFQTFAQEIAKSTLCADPDEEAEARRAWEAELVERLHGYAAELRSWVTLEGLSEKTVVMATALADAYASATCSQLADLRELFESEILDKPTSKKQTGLGTFYKKKLGGAEAAARVKEQCIAYLQPAAALRRAEQDRFDHMRRLAEPFVTLYRRRLAAEGRIAFDELLRLTRDLLRNFPTIAARLQSNISLLLLDEVQDTDPVQYDIVRELRRPRAGGSAPGIFLVGDPKQSVYRFRGADIAAFQDEIDQWDAIKLDLDSNFRSDPRILIAVNRLFSGSESAWIEAPRIQPPYQPLSPVLEEKGEDPVVELWTIEDDSPEGKKFLIDKARRAEGVVVAESIAERIQAGATPGEFAILMRKLTQVEPYLRALRRCGVPFLVDGGRKFAKRPEVREFLALANAVVHPADTSARFAFFRSTLGAVPDDEFAAHIAAGGSLDADAEKPDAACCPQLAGAWARLEEASARRSQGDDAGWLQWLLQFGPLQILHAAAFEGAQRIANLERLVQTATLRLRRDELSIEETLERLGDEDTPAIDRDATLADAGRNAVRIMTIHGAKGLEFPYVYLPAAGDPSRGPSDKGLKVRRQRAGVNHACHGVSMDNRHDLVGSFARNEEDRHAEAELQRLLYVATTRAKNSLTLVRSGKPPKTLKGWSLTLEAWSNSATDGVEHRVFQAFADRLLDTDRKPRCVLSLAVGEDIAPRVHTPRVLAATPATSPTGNEEFSIAAAIGTVLHRALEILPAREPERLTTFVDRAATTCIEDLALDESEALELRGQTAAIAKAFSSGTLGERWKTIEILGREIPLLSQGDARSGSIDLVYRDTGSDANLVLVDYKTDRTTNDSQLIERHQEQIGRYADGLRSALNLSGDIPLRRELWLLRQDRILIGP